MAITKMISAIQLRETLGADASLQPRVAAIHKSSCARVRRYARGAPVEVRNEAVILLAGVDLSGDGAIARRLSGRPRGTADQRVEGVSVERRARALVELASTARGRVGDLICAGRGNVPPSSIEAPIPIKL